MTRRRLHVIITFAAVSLILVSILALCAIPGWPRAAVPSPPVAKFSYEVQYWYNATVLANGDRAKNQSYECLVLELAFFVARGNQLKKDECDLLLGPADEIRGDMMIHRYHGRNSDSAFAIVSLDASGQFVREIAFSDEDP